MFIDARQLPPTTSVEADVCIVGAGAAGITIARELIGSPLRVALLESGGLEPDAEVQDLNKGENIGLPYFALDQLRLRYFGGTTNHWTGSCRPLDPMDFEVRPWIANSGWPIGKAELDPFYARAQAICQLGPYDYAVESWETGVNRRLPLIGDRVVTAVLQRSPPTRFGQVYREEIEKAANVKTFLFANVVDIATTPNAHAVTRVNVSTLAGNTFTVSARAFVLATGALENARTLLAARTVQSAGLGNQHDLVGRFFMEHVNAEAAILLLSNRSVRPDFYLPTAVTQARRNSASPAFAYLGLSPAVQKEEQLANARVIFRPGVGGPGVLATSPSLLAETNERVAKQTETGGLLAHVHNLLADIDNAAVASYLRLFRYPRVLNLVYQIEQVPNPESRLTLGPDRDRFGIPRPQLNWRMTDLERRTLDRFIHLVAEECGRASIGRVRALPDDPSTGWPSPVRAVSGTRHQMGTTRMHDAPSRGVVDRQCRVHGTANLYIAGSSVFPTSGCANPTLTIVALALRMAEHVKQELS